MLQFLLHIKMIDTIGIHLISPEQIPYINPLFIRRTWVDPMTGVYYVNGNNKNMKIRTSQTDVFIEGSIAKYYLGSNLRTLKFNEYGEAINSLSKELNIDITAGRIYRLDIAENIPLKFPVANYLISFAGIKGLRKMVIGAHQTVTYSNTSCALSFYEKISEMTRRRVAIPDEYKLLNGRVLRYELRLLKKPERFFKMTELNIKNLLEESFYKKMVELWKESYFRIEKVSDISITPESFSNVKNFEKIFAKLGIMKFGYEKVEALISGANVSQQRFQKSRLKKKLQEIMRWNGWINNDLIKELDNKILAVTGGF